MIKSLVTFRRAAFAGAVFAACAASPAFASTTAGNTLGVSATVTSNCSVSTSPVAFGNVDVTTGSAVNGSGNLLVTCTNGTAWSAAADAGLGTGASLATRKMASGADLLDYALYTDSGRTTLFGDGVTGATVDDTGTGSQQSKTVYGKVLASQQSAPAGSYADTVTVTVTY